MAEPKRKLREADAPPSSIYPKLKRKPGINNWVDKAGGLPEYIERIAKHIHYEHGKDISTAIAMAVNTVKRWAKGTNNNGGKLKPDTVAKAQAAVADWEKKKASSHVSEAFEKAIPLVDAGTLPDTALRAAVAGRFVHELNITEGMRSGLKGAGTRNRAGKVSAAAALLEGAPPKIGIKGNADPQELARVKSRLGHEAAVLRSLCEAFGVAPVGPPRQAQQMRRPPQAKGRNGQAVFDESKHPRAGSGSPTGGQFIKSGSSGAEVKGIQRSVGAKPDGRFGPETKRKVEGFQQAKGLTVDGIVGGQTAAALNGNKGLPGPLLSHHRQQLRTAKITPADFSPAALAAADAKEKRQNKARAARKEVSKEIASEEKAERKKARQEREGKIKSSSSSSSGSSTSSSTTAGSGGAGSVFGEGSSLPSGVADLIQKRLGISTSGSYDEATKARVEEFQKNHGLQVDGIVGTQTLAAMRGDETPPAPGAFTTSDWKWLEGHSAAGGKAKAKDKPSEEAEINTELGPGTVRENGPKQSSEESQKAHREAEQRRITRERKREERKNAAKAPAKAALVEAVANDDFHRKYGAGMKDAPDEATGHLQGRLTELGYDSGASDGRFGDRTQAAVEQFQSDHGLKKDGVVGSSTKVALRGTDAEEVARARTSAGAAEEAEEEAPEADAKPAEEEEEPKPEAGGAAKETPKKDAPPATEDGGDEEDGDAPSLAGTVLSKGAGVGDEEPDPNVKHLQKTIGVEEDGRFGPETEKKVKSTQRRYGLKADGVVGPKTGRLLDRMAAKSKPKKGETNEDKKLNEAVLDRMEASVEGGAAFIRARARESAARELAEANLRDSARDLTRDFYRLSDGTFAPKGRGRILTPGEKINLPHQDGGGKVKATVEHVSGGRGLARISDGPDKGKLASVRTAAPAGSSSRPFPEAIRHRSSLPPGKPGNASHQAEITSQNHLDHLNDAITRGSDGDVQDVLDDMAGDHEWSEKKGYGAANKNYDRAKERGEGYLSTGGKGEPMHAPIDFMSASDGELDTLIDKSLDPNGNPRSGRDKSIFLTALSVKKERAKKAFDKARSGAAKEAASDQYMALTGIRLYHGEPSMHAPPEGYEPNGAEKQLKDMAPGDTFYVGKYDEPFKFHKHTAGGPFIIAKPLNGGKAKPFHEEMAPSYIGPSDPSGSPSSSPSPPAPPATNEADLYDALKGSLEQAGAGAPTTKTGSGSSPARSSKGNLRNFKAMSTPKLAALGEEMKDYPEDEEAIAAIVKELQGRTGQDAMTKAPKNKLAQAKAEGKQLAGEPAKGPDEKKLAAAWKAYDAKKAAYDALPSDADKKEKSKLASQVRAAKTRIKRVGGDPKKRPDSVPEPGKKTGTPVSQPKKTVPDKPKTSPDSGKIENLKEGDWFVAGPNGDLWKVTDKGNSSTEAVSPANPDEPQAFPHGTTILPATAEDVEVGEQALGAVTPSDAELAAQKPDRAEGGAVGKTLTSAASELGPEWDQAKVAAALDQLETQGIVFDRDNESPSVIAAVIKAANLDPKGT